MAIRLSGLSSGLDTDTLISKLMELERKPLVLMQNNNTVLQSRKTDLSGLKTSLFTLQGKITDLTYASTYAKRIASTTDEKIVTASAQNSSSNASYNINVISMATSTRNTGAALAFASGTKASMVSTEELNVGAGLNAAPNAAFSTGMAGTGLESNVNAGYFIINNVRIDVLATDTINTILNKITESGAGVTASLAGDQITLTQKTVGDTPTIKLGTDTSGFLTAVKLTGATVTPGVKSDENRLLKDTALGAGLTNGYFSINGAFISVDKDKDTLASIIDKINQSTVAGVTAFYDASSKKISLTSKTTGAKNIELGTNPGTDTSNFLNSVGLVPGGQVAGNPASVEVNGVAVTAENNTVTLNGVTFNLKSEGTATVTVKNDVDSMVEKIKGFVDQYNTVMDMINAELAESKVSEPTTTAELTSGNLKGDSLLISIRANLRSFAYASVASLPSSMQQLSQIGISTGAVGSSLEQVKSGTLVLDEAKLRKALETNPEGVAALLGKGTASVTGESLGNGDGTNTTFTLAKTPVAAAPQPSITVDGEVYTLVAGDPSTVAGSKEYSINYNTGVITFGIAPAAGKEVKATYDYDVTSGSEAGIAVRLKSVLGELTRVGGTFDGRIGSKGSVTKQISYQEKRIEDMERRLKMREEALYRQFTALETLMSKMNSQSSWLTAQLAQLPTSSSGNE